MKSPLIIVTASGLAREVSEAARACGDRQIKGFLDDDPAQWGKNYAGVEVLGPLEQVAEFPDADVVLCAGRGWVRQSLESRLVSHGFDESRFATIVHPSAVLPADAAIADGTVVLAGCVLTASVTIGRHVVIMPNVTLTHDDSLADFATLCAGVALGGNVGVGARAYIGMLAGIRENVTVGADSVVGMGSVVIRDVPAQQTWAGVPAQPIVAVPPEPRASGAARRNNRNEA